MNKATIGSWIFVFGCLNGLAQTNSAVSPEQLFELPQVSLRALVPLPEKPSAPTTVGSESRLELNLQPARQQELSLVPSTPSDPRLEEMTVSRGRDHGEFYGPLQPGHFYLIQQEPRSDSGFVRAAEGIFVPEPIRLGKTTVSCSIVTAIKRKNPLCLLNPIFFTLSW